MTTPRRWLALIGGVLVLTALPARPAAAEPGDTVSALVAELGTLYRESDRAARSYEETARRLRDRRAEVRRLDERLATARTDLAAARRTAGEIARAQYRHGGDPLPATLRMLLGEDPRHDLHAEAVARRVAAHQAAEIARLTEGERRADALATEARAALDAERTRAEEERRAREVADDRLAEVTRLLADAAPTTPLAATGTDGTNDDNDTTAGDRALAAALDRVGQAYDDPAALAADAWADTGRTLPATPARMWADLPHASLGDLRPGDLVVYHTDASHVGVYAGEGQVVHAPAPGEPVAVAPVAVRPVLGAVRPG
ncbi:NlpC/P60 family protein [Streptomyces sp. RFCAC02]|uniref:C40 family peptidase n=1 Tax=Streptomyces sp. RFCAC02 TaxID=2499143 RepID=UPI0010224CF8|nr:NlpC/P60 family protein [Streptomyces sp. RFCAC02]